jgi:hypothetical protein
MRTAVRIWTASLVGLGASPAWAAFGTGGGGRGLLKKPISEWGAIDWGFAALAAVLLYSAFRKAMDKSGK